MSENVLGKPKRNSAAKFGVVADQLLAEMKRLDELMQKDRTEIDTCKAETARLTLENRLVLSRLKAMV